MRRGYETRVRLYRHPQAQLILSAFLTGRLSEIKPMMDSGGVQRFPLLEDLLGAPPVEVTSLVKKLVNERVLAKKSYQRVICCPYCGDQSNVFVRHLCLACKSTNLSIERTIRHLVCGGVVRVGANGYSKAICEKCLTPIVGDGDCVLLGTSLFCNDCGTVNREIIQTYFCSSCNREFSLTNAGHLDIYSYSLNKRLVKEIQQNMVLPFIMNFLAERGFNVQTPGYLTTTFGATRSFTITATQGDRVLAFDMVQSNGEIGLPSIIPTVLKLAGQKSATGFLIAIPCLNSEARVFAVEMGVRCIEGRDLDVSIRSPEEVYRYLAEALLLSRDGHRGDGGYGQEAA